MNKMRTPLSNIMKIMTIVLKRIEKKGLSGSGKTPLVKGLLKKGFRMEDINTAMRLISLMTQQVNPIIKVSDSKSKGIRHLHELEAIRMTPEAQKLLLTLIEADLISSLHFEKIIEYIWKNDLRHVGVTRLELLIALNRPASETEELDEEPLPRSLSIH